jgi:hypothetical protein
MNPADVQLIKQIHEATHGGSRLLVTLARRGKAIELHEPQRAAFLLAGVRTHPLYKGGRLAFDMLEIEDLILDSSRADSMSTREVIQVLNSSAQHLIETLRQMGVPVHAGDLPLPASTRESDGSGSSVFAGAGSADETGAATELPRVSLGPEDATTHAEGRDTRGSEPELRSSDYLYDYVVVGWLDVASNTSMFQG